MKQKLIGRVSCSEEDHWQEACEDLCCLARCAARPRGLPFDALVDALRPALKRAHAGDTDPLRPHPLARARASDAPGQWPCPARLARAAACERAYVPVAPRLSPRVACAGPRRRPDAPLPPLCLPAI